MRGWLRYFALNAQVRTGVSAGVLVLAIIAAAAAAAAVVFLLVAAFVWLADLYDALTAGVVLGCAFALIALIALVACLMTRRRNMARAPCSRVPRPRSGPAAISHQRMTTRRSLKISWVSVRAWERHPAPLPAP